MFIYTYLDFIPNYPLSRFPQGGKAINRSSFPCGESLPRASGGWEGGKKIVKVSGVFLLITETHF
jgi:hypothetical protein